MRFEEFLKKNRSNYPSETIEWVSINALGEWAWESIKGNVEYFLDLSSAKTTKNQSTLFNRVEKHSKKSMFNFEVSLEIALACFGRIELEYRLKQLQGNSTKVKD